MKAMFLVGSLLIFSNGFAQSWRLIPENDTLYFASRGSFSYINWSNDKQIEVSDYTLGVAEEIDSAGINIQSLHKGWIPCDYCEGDTVGDWIVSNQYSWLGERILNNPNGRITGGKAGMEWVIDLESGIGVNWLWMDGDSMRLVSVGIESIYGQTDSVRNYESDLGDHLKLSKSGGMLAFHFHKEHGYSYRYIGSQKRRDHCYIPSFHDYYIMNMQEWICAINENFETSMSFIKQTELTFLKPIEINRYPDSIRTKYRHFRHSRTESLQGNPAVEKESKVYYEVSSLYLKSRYDSLSSPFAKASIPSFGIEFFLGLQIRDDSNASNYYLPCYFISSGKTGFFNRPKYSIETNQDSVGNKVMQVPEHDSSFFLRFGILNGSYDSYRFDGFEHGGFKGICGISSINNNPDTSGFFPLSIPDLPEVHIYPNPFIDHLFLAESMLYTGWSLLNFQGQEVAAGVFESNQIELSGLANGVYILQLRRSDGSSHFVRVSKE